jgi:hypothetical protein
MRSCVVSLVARRPDETALELGPDRGPLVGEDAEDDGVAERAVLAAHVAAQHAFALRAELGDRRLGAGVQRVGLDLYATVAAVVEAVCEQQEFGLGG